MATSTATPEPSASAGLEPSIAIAASDTVTQRRIIAALTDGGCLAAPDSAAPRPRGAGVVVLAADLSDPDAAAAVKATRESAPDAALVVVTPPGRDWEIRRALRAGAQGIVFDAQLERTLPAAVRAAAAGLVAVPRALRHQIVKPVFSHREREILALVAEGATNREIADRLYLAESTVKSHLSTAFSKLGVRSRAEAAALVLDPVERPIDVLPAPHEAGTELALGSNGSSRGGSI
jgi:DNA-binding NarL/FixJ family response regulator